jgi:hypothetical protein
MNDSKTKTTDTATGCLLVILGIFVLWLVGTMIAAPSKTSEQIQEEQQRDAEKEERRERAREEDDAYYYAKEFVKDRLVSPYTAVFPQRSECPVCTVIKKSGKLYRVMGYVDAQNRYGAMVRMSYLCDIRLYEGKAGCENIKITER